MEARETTFERLIQGDNQFQIPLYQRTYSWDVKDHQRLWDDLLQQAVVDGTEDAPTGHFLGSLVLDPRAPLPDTVQRWVVIDGQQRLTTLMLLACAIRDHVRTFDTGRADLVHRRYLVNEEDYTGLDAYKLLPTQADRPSYLACVNSDPTAGGEDSIGAAYRFFRAALTEYDPVGEWETVRHIDQALRRRLTLVTITAGPQDNAFRIFESLNNTGKSLSQADLLRNYVFMQLPTLGEQVYDRVWLPLQTELGPERLTTLAWLDLVLQGQSRSTVSEVYEGQRRRMGRIVAAAGEEGLREDLTRLRRLGHLLLRVFEPDREPRAELGAVLERLWRWGGEAHYPPALHVLDQVDRGETETAQAVEALSCVESFLVRRMICREPSHSVRQLLAAAPSGLERDRPLHEAMRRYLSGPRRGWPQDADLVEAIRTQPFYWQGSSRHRAYVLRRFEEDYASPEPVDFSRAWASIEHVLPQRPGQEWLDMLAEDAEEGERAEELHEALVHTLGNLTLSGENTRLSNHPYERKQQILDQSALRMNREIATADRWGRPEILARADRLAERAVRIWPGPLAGEQARADERSEWLRLRRVLAAVPAGKWATYKDLGAVTGAGSAQTVGSYLAKHADVPNAHRVLTAGGTSSPGFAWLDGRTESQQEALEREGVRFDGAVADARQRLLTTELAELAGLDAPEERAEDSAVRRPGTPAERPEHFAALLRAHQPAVAEEVLTLLGKWEAEGGWLGYGAAAETSCAPMLREGRGPQGCLWPVSVYPRSGAVEVVFEYLAKREPFTRPGLLAELRDRLQAVPGVVLDVPDAELHRRRPSFPLEALRGEGLARFAEALEWFRQQSL
ncbi:GmrSD restriction endonuclease domain-containing protein [Streptomyces chrestomyceticus]|uniref:GmrSD restriction endonuclease domain-containing protein n=1 Tax=Streptomyces chrestomyceticus TaxID=68185 RepID=UPI0037946ACA